MSGFDLPPALDLGVPFGTEQHRDVRGLKEALARTDSTSAASTAMTIQQAVTECWREPLEDDATVVVMAVD